MKLPKEAIYDNDIVRQTEDYIPYTDEDLKDHTAIVAAIISEADGVVYVKTMHHVKLGKLSFPMGKCKDGQSETDGMMEELKEELGIIPTTYNMIGIGKGLYERNGQIVTDTEYMFSVEAWNGVIENNEPDKCHDLKWTELTVLYELLESDPESMTILTQKCLTALRNYGIC